MTRKKLKSAQADGETSTTAQVTEEPPAANSSAVASAEVPQDPPPTEAKNWGPPYKAIFVCPAKGFEMGEDRRFRQRVFKFTEKPSENILAALKENGFIYRPGEKTWTISASSETRLLADRLAKEFEGAQQAASR